MEDNLSAHKLAALYEVYPPARARNIVKKLEVVRTPKHGSCGSPPGLNIAECELSVLTRQGLKNRVPDLETLKRQVQCWYEQRNSDQAQVNWQFTTKDARVKLKKLYPSV